MSGTLNVASSRWGETSYAAYRPQYHLRDMTTSGLPSWEGATARGSRIWEKPTTAINMAAKYRRHSEISPRLVVQQFDAAEEAVAHLPIGVKNPLLIYVVTGRMRDEVRASLLC